MSNIARDPLWADYRELAFRFGLAACWSTPIYSSHQEILGTFAIYYRERRQPTAADFEIMERMTHLAGIAIERHRSEESARELSEVIHTLTSAGEVEYDTSGARAATIRYIPVVERPGSKQEPDNGRAGKAGDV